MPDTETTIQPALTPEQWTVALNSYHERRRMLFRSCDPWTENAHVCAALALYGQPVGFTQDDVDALEYLVGEGSNSMLEHPSTWYSDDDRAKVGIAERAIAKIRALLPPK